MKVFTPLANQLAQAFCAWIPFLSFRTALRPLAVWALIMGIVIATSDANAQCVLLNDDFSSAPPLAATNTDGAWYPDRYPPAGFTSDAGRLKISISAADGAQLRPSGYSSAFYNTQGRKFNQCGKCVTVLKGDLYIPSDWATNHRRSDMWATAFDISDAVSFYPIIGFRNVTGANPQMSYWDGTAWVELGAPSNGYDTWYALEMRLNGADVEYLIDNVVVGTVSSGGSVYFGDIIMQAYNFNDNTLTGGAYDPGPDNSYDAFWDNLVTTGTGGNVVTNLNTGETFCKIQAAIDAPLTLAGHTIEVGPGTYNENVLINKNDLTIRSTGGKGVTTIQGTLAGGNYGTVAIASGTNGVTLGQSGKGFTIIGFDGTGGIEAAAVYLLGAHTDITVEGNEIRADGDHGLLSNYNAAIDGILINDNMFTGKTFLGAEPGGCGFATQFDPGNNVPRQLVTMGGGAGVTASKNVTFTNNMVTGTTGGYNSTGACEQGNQLVTIDVIGADIRNNIFNGTTTRGAYSLRTRGKLTSIGCNTFHSDFLSATCAHIFFGSPAPLTGASPSTLAGVASVNAFPDGGAYLTPDHPGSWIIFKDMAQAVAAAGLIGAGQAPVPAAPAFTCPVTNTNTGNVFCSIQDGIEASMTLSGHVLAVPACSYSEFVDAVAPGKDITLAPGASPGCVTITGGLTLGSGDALDMEINGTSACTDYDRFSVNGAVTLGGATLTLTLGYVPSPGDSYTLIANDGADPVSGQFAQGATISSGGYVFSINYTGGDGNDVVLTSCGTGNVQNTDTGEWFCSIQAAIDDAQTLDGHTLSVNAGTYAEDITVNKSLTILGPNAAIDPCSGSRVAEAVVVPKTKDIGATVLFYIAANTDNVSIKGFTLNGDNTALTSGFTSTNGADIDAAEGVATYETGVDNLVVQNNIFKNFSYFGVTHYDYPAGVPSSGHDISNNKFMDLGTYDAGSGISYWGGGVLLYNNAYAHVSNNCMTNVRSGVQTGNFYLPNPGAATYQVIEDNTIQARRRGIFHNLFYSSASPYTLDDNAITALNHASESYWDGILISSHQGVASTTSDNVIDGSAITGKPTEGIEVWNVRSTAPATISGGSVTGVSIGLFVNNYEGYVSDAGEGAHTVVSGLTVTDCPVGAKIFDSPSSTLHAAVNATIQTDCHFSHSSGGTTGILVAGAAASATIQDNSASFHGFTTGIDVDAGSATIDNNHIYDNTTGIRFTNGGSGTVTDNDFTGATSNDTDLRLDASAGTVGADGGNHFAGSVYGVDNQSAAVVDAENNYWNDATGPGAPPYAFGAGAEITANVDYCPFYGAPGGPALPAANCSFLFSGTILWEHDGASGVKDATVNLTGAGSGSDLTDASGDYLIAPPYAAGNYTLTPVKSINKLNGVTVADAVAIQQHVAYITLITSLYKKVAADVNKSNSISTIDATIINQSLLGNPAALLQFKTSWRFVPQSHTMIDPPWGFPESISLPGVMASQTDQDFYGIKTGDVVATWANPANFGAGNPLVLTVQDQTLQTGAVATVGFKAGQLDDIAAFQLVLKFDPDKLALAEIIPQTGLPLTVDNFGTYNLSRGDIRIVWAQAKGVLIEEATLVFALKFNVLQSGGKLSEVISIDETELPALAYNSALAESKAELRFSETTAVGDLNGANGLQLLQNRPNPFNGTTTIGFVLPESGEAQLRVFDAAGRLLAERKGQYPAGRSEETVDLSGASGVLWYELTTPFGVLTRKMATARE